MCIRDRARADLGQLLLGQVEIDVDRVERLERDDGVARLEVLAQIDEADAKAPRKGRLDGPLRYGRPYVVRRRESLLVRRPVRVELGLRDGGLCEQFTRPIQVDLGELDAGLRRAEHRLLDGGVLANEQVARLDLAARLEGHLDLSLIHI